jgi:hypothetical protein
MTFPVVCLACRPSMQISLSVSWLEPIHSLIDILDVVAMGAILSSHVIV